MGWRAVWALALGLIPLFVACGSDDSEVEGAWSCGADNTSDLADLCECSADDAFGSPVAKCSGYDCCWDGRQPEIPHRGCGCANDSILPTNCNDWIARMNADGGEYVSVAACPATPP